MVINVPDNHTIIASQPRLQVMPLNETPMVLECRGEKLMGVLHPSTVDNPIGVLIVVGGPQTRVGSHRQFVLLARTLAKRGIPVMRFDVRGMGDSDGAQRHFDELDDDIRTAIDYFFATKAGLERVVIWGLCDAAAAALFYAYQDRRVAGLVLLNPWVSTEQGAAKTYLKYYYLQRILSWDFWKKLVCLKFDMAASLTSMCSLLKKASKLDTAVRITVNSSTRVIDTALPLPQRMRECFRLFAKPVLLILSGRDFTAAEFKQVVASDTDWQALLKSPQLTWRDFPEADHTFSSAAWREQVAEWTTDWVEGL